MPLESTGTNGVEEAESTETIDVAGVFGHFERDLNVRLSTEIVDLSGLDLGDNIYEVGAVAQVTIVELKFVGPCDHQVVSLYEYGRVWVGTYSHAGRRRDVATCWY